MHGSETWPMKVEHELKLNRTEMSMIRWMCGVKLNERKKSEELVNVFCSKTAFNNNTRNKSIVPCWTMHTGRI